MPKEFMLGSSLSEPQIVTVFRDRICKEVITLLCGHEGGPSFCMTVDFIKRGYLDADRDRGKIR